MRTSCLLTVSCIILTWWGGGGVPAYLKRGVCLPGWGCLLTWRDDCLPGELVSGSLWLIYFSQRLCFWVHCIVYFSGGSRISRGGGVSSWFYQISPKTAWNRKNLDARGGVCVPHAPLRSTNVLSWTFCHCFALWLVHSLIPHSSTMVKTALESGNGNNKCSCQVDVIDLDLFVFPNDQIKPTRLHSSRMRTARPLTVVPIWLLLGRGGGRVGGDGEVNDPSHPRGGGGRWWSCLGGRSMTCPILCGGGGGPLRGGGWGVVMSTSPCDHVTYSMMHLVSPPPQYYRMTDACEKHNLRSLRYAGGNYIYSIPKHPVIMTYLDLTVELN